MDESEKERYQNQDKGFTVAIGINDVAQRVSLLLQTISTIASALNAAGEDPAPFGGKLDGGLKAALEAVSLRAVNQLDDLLSRPDIWDTENITKLHRALLSNEERRGLMLEAQRRMFELASSPSVLFRPRSMVLADGRIMVYYGPEDSPADWIVGIGKSLLEAMQDFDVNASTGKTLKSIAPSLFEGAAASKFKLYRRKKGKK